MARSALVLAGHGSHISPHTAGVVWQQVDALRAMGAADEITAAFWKEQPSFSQVLRTLTAEDITIVPVFTARGYFTQTVIPSEMNLDGAITYRDGRTIRYARTLGEHSSLGETVRRRVLEAMRELNAPPERTAVAIIGHSTRRSPESRKAAEVQADALRAANIVAQVQAVFLDDTPEIADIYTLTNAPNLIAVPYFVAAGSHTTHDVPKRLLLPEGKTRAHINGRSVFYTAPVGVDESLIEAIIALAQEAGAPLREPENRATWSGFPAAGRELLEQAVSEAGELRFGQLRLTPSAIYVWDDDRPDAVIDNPSNLRALVRENPFRPLMTGTDLPCGWRVQVNSAEMLHAVVETIYPGVVADLAAYRSGTFSSVPLQDLAARQTGMYRKIGKLSPEQSENGVKDICGKCVLHPAWHSQMSEGALLCAEACNFWMSRILEGIE